MTTRRFPTPILVLSLIIIASLAMTTVGLAAPQLQDTPPPQETPQLEETPQPEESPQLEDTPQPQDTPAPLEPNNSFGKAAAITLGVAVQDTISPRGDVDWYRFTTPSQGELQMRVTNVPATLDITFRVFNAERDQVSDSFVPFAKGRDTQGIVDLAGPGVYYIELQDSGGDGESTQPYTLQTVFTAADDPEPNNRAPQAAPLTLGEPFQATILPMRDTDWFFVDVDIHGELAIITTQVPPTLDIMFRVYNANFDVMRDWFYPLTTGADNYGAVDLPDAGRYYIEVRDQGDNARSAAPYTLQADFIPSPDTAEPNNGFGPAAPMTVGVPITGTILPRYDSDWYRFAVAEQGVLSLTVATVPPELDIAFRLWNANRELVTDWFRTTAIGLPTTGAVELGESGIYVLELKDDGDDARSVAPYLLHSELLPTGDRGEPNNSFGKAYPLGPGGEYEFQASILPRRDVDWYEIVVDRAGVLSVTLASGLPDLDLEFRLWTANRDVAVNWIAPAEIGATTAAYVDLGEAGRHLLEVHDHNDDASGVAPYTLVTTFDPAPDANEPNQDLSIATPIELDAAVTAAIFPRGDVDWYAVTLAAPGDLHIQIADVAPELDVVARLFRADGSAVADWLRPPAAGADTIGVVAVPDAGVYYLHVADNNHDARSLQPYTLLVSAQSIATPEPTPTPEAEGATPGAPIPDTAPPAEEPTPTAAEPTPAPTEEAAADVPAVRTTVSSAGGDVSVDAPSDPAGGARLNVPPDAVNVDTDFTLTAGGAAPDSAPLGLFPAGYYWELIWTVTPQTLSLAEPATLSLPIPDELADTPMFVGNWTGEEWVALETEGADGFVAAPVVSPGLYAAFCGDLADYRIVGFTNSTRSREIDIALIAGPVPVDDADTATVTGCPPPTDPVTAQTVRRRSTADFWLRPGQYEVLVTYLLPEPAVTATMVITVPPGAEPITVEVAEDGATGDTDGVVIDFAGRGG